MNTYVIELWGHESTCSGETAAKAKYPFFLDHEIGDSCSFVDFVKQVSCRLLRKFRPVDLFGDAEQFNRMKVHRGIEFAYQGMRIEVNGHPGVIVGSNSSLNLNVCYDGECWERNCHPHWRVKYYDSRGNVVAEYGD